MLLHIFYTSIHITIIQIHTRFSNSDPTLLTYWHDLKPDRIRQLSLMADTKAEHFSGFYGFRGRIHRRPEKPELLRLVALVDIF